MKKLLLVLSLAMATMSMQAQENQFSMSAQLRTRAEYRNGSIFPRGEGADFTSFINDRTRLSISYVRANNLELKISGQQVGVWGQDPQVNKDGRYDLNEAWAKLKHGNVYAQIGRQPLVYDDERLLGDLDWNVAGRSHDAFKLAYEKNADKLHLILAFNQNGEKVNSGTYYADGGQPYKSMQTLWYNHQFAKPMTLSLLFMNLGQEGGVWGDAKTRYMQTMGFHFTAQPTNWDLVASFYYQTGKTASNLDISALMASVKAGYIINPRWKATFGFDFMDGEDYEWATRSFSGDIEVHKADPTKTRAFNPLYGTHHKFYGAMDYFYASSFINGLAPGLQDIQLSVDYKATKNTAMQLAYHYFLTASDILVTDGKTLGSEIDLQININLMKSVTMMIGYSTMFGTDTMDAVKGGDHSKWQDWAWISLNINPQFISRL
ncbi:MAG: alginate export family protein [Bacteroidales bacterium]|nr:alginate export family protein [Bacteroidales bacterium]